MARFSGKVGFSAGTHEVRPGVWADQIVERIYYGDSNRYTRRSQNSGQVNDNLVISNEISIVADPFASENLGFIRYVEFMGAKWKVTNINVQHPRLILTLGEVYNV